jgi:hypothetical protein
MQEPLQLWPVRLQTQGEIRPQVSSAEAVADAAAAHRLCSVGCMLGTFELRLCLQKAHGVRATPGFDGMGLVSLAGVSMAEAERTCMRGVRYAEEMCASTWAAVRQQI